MGAGHVQKFPAPRVIQINDRPLRRRCSKPLKETTLCFIVVLEVLVVIQMVAGQIGENSDRIREAPDPFLRQGMRGDFHHHTRATRIDGLSEVRPQIKRLRSRIERRQGAVTNSVLDSSEEAGADSGGAQNTVHQKGCRSLSVRPGDSY